MRCFFSFVTVSDKKIRILNTGTLIRLKLEENGEFSIHLGEDCVIFSCEGKSKIVPVFLLFFSSNYC